MNIRQVHTRLLQLLTELSYEEREVILASGKPSNFYIDCKQTVLTAEGHHLVGTLICDVLTRESPEVKAKPTHASSKSDTDKPKPIKNVTKHEISDNPLEGL